VDRNCNNKTRVFQNCCGGSGMHALFIAWKNAARFDKGTLSVNLHIDKLMPQAEIRGYQPVQGVADHPAQASMRRAGARAGFCRGKERGQLR